MTDTECLVFAKRVWDKLMDMRGGWIDVSDDGLDDEIIELYQALLAQEVCDFIGVEKQKATYHVMLGDIVLLQHEYKPGTPSWQLMHNVESGEMMPGLEYPHWDGFTHGIVACVEDRGNVVFLYLYDVTSHSLYVSENGLPVRAQYSADELKLVRKAGDFQSLVNKKKV